MTKWHPGELYPRVGFIVTNLSRPAERVVGFCNQRRTAEQWIKEGKNAMKWTPLSCSSFAANAVRIQLHALAYNLANFMRAPALPEAGGGGSKGYQRALDVVPEDAEEAGGGGSKGYQRETCASMAGNRAISGLRKAHVRGRIGSKSWRVPSCAAIDIARSSPNGYHIRS